MEIDHPDNSNETKLTIGNLAAHGEPAEHKFREVDDASESDLSEIDDNLFKDYTHDVPVNRPVVPIDEDAIAKLGVHRRQRDPNEVSNDQPVKKIARRIKRRRTEEGDEEELGSRGGKGIGGGHRKHRGEGERIERPARILTAEEQRIADLDAKIGEALKSKTKRRKKKDEVVSSLPGLYLVNHAG